MGKFEACRAITPAHHRHQRRCHQVVVDMEVGRDGKEDFGLSGELVRVVLDRHLHQQFAAREIALNVVRVERNPHRHPRSRSVLGQPRNHGGPSGA